MYKVEAMRTIQLFSAVFDTNNNKIGREVMKRVEELNLIPKNNLIFKNIDIRY